MDDDSTGRVCKCNRSHFLVKSVLFEPDEKNGSLKKERGVMQGLGSYNSS